MISDNNIDTLSDNNAHNNFNNHEIKEPRYNFMTENSLILHHNKATFHKKGQAPCLNYIYLIVTQGLKMSQLRKVFLPDRKNYNLHIQ